jgi:hypothetical protein
MTAFKNTLVGRFLKGAAKVVLPVVGVITGIGAIGGIGKGVGALNGIGKVVTTVAGGVKSVIDKVGGAAVGLITGETKDEQAQIAAVKERVKAAQDKLDQVARLIKAGASEAEARATVGLSETEYAAVKTEIVSAGYTELQPVSASVGGGIMDLIKKNPVVAVVGAGLLLFVLPSLLKKRR